MLRKPLLVSLIVLWCGYCLVSFQLCITSFSDHTHPQHQETTRSNPFHHAKKVLSDSLGPVVDFAIGPVTQFVLNLPNGQVECFFEEFKLQKNCVIDPVHQNDFGAS